MAHYNGNGNDNTINGSNNADDIYGKAGKDMLYGNGGDDYIDGGVGADFLFGGDGNDTLFGGKGDDTMEGGLGADQFKGGQGIDTADYSSATSGLTVWIPSGYTSGYSSGDTFVNVENLTGSAYADSLQAAGGGKAFGGGGNDYIFGSNDGSGNAGILRGDAGFDNIYMDYGRTSAWLQYGQGSDTIHYFTENDDTFFIDLSEFGLGNTLDSNEVTNSNTVTATGANAQFIYDGDDSRLYFDSNGNGAGGLTLIADLENESVVANTLDSGDFQYQV